MSENNNPTTEQKEHASMLFTDYTRKIKKFYDTYNPSTCTANTFTDKMDNLTDRIGAELCISVMLSHITDEQAHFIAKQMDNLNKFLFIKMKTEYPEIFHDDLSDDEEEEE